MNELARILGRPIGRGGGLRDRLRHGLRHIYVTVAVSPETASAIENEALERGLSVASFLGMIVESAFGLKRDAFDDLLAGESSDSNPSD